MAGFSVSLGKGLIEPCSPYRQANVFGAELNSPEASNWNCLPNIVGSTATFDLSKITINHEVCVALAKLTGLEEGSYSVRFRFYKDFPTTLLFDYTYSFSAWEGQWFYAYAFIGWTSWEINDNGEYFVLVNVGGQESLYKAIYFTVTGIKVAEPEPTPPPEPAEGIIGALNSVSEFFYSIYLKVLGWVWPFNELADLFYGISLLFSKLGWAFSTFITLVNYLVGKVADILSWDYIRGLILGWLPWLVNLGAWFQSWWSNVLSSITSWWSATSVTVHGWIDAATQYFNSVATAWSNFWNNLWPQLTTSFNSLKSAWDNFWKVTFPNLVSFTWLTTWWNDRAHDVQDLINSGFTARNSLWAGWQDMKNNVVTFFQDPVEFIWQRFTDWFLGPEG